VSPSQLKAVLKYIEEQLKRSFSAGAFWVTFVPGAALLQANGECCAFGAKYPYRKGRGLPARRSEA
jgi:hypothetical protein